MANETAGLARDLANGLARDEYSGQEDEYCDVWEAQELMLGVVLREKSDKECCKENERPCIISDTHNRNNMICEKAACSTRTH